MKPFSVLLYVGIAFIGLSGNVALAATVAERPLVPLLKAEEITTQCERGLKDFKVQLTALEKLSMLQAQPAKKVFAQWNSLQIAIENLQGPIELLNNVSPDPKVRASAEPCLIKVGQFMADLFQNEKLYRLIKTTSAQDPIDTKLRQDLLDGFEDTGVNLSPAKRTRMKAILTRMDELSQEFSRNIRDNKQKLVFKPEEMKGLSGEFLAKAKRDSDGNYLLGFEYPEYIPFMEYADDGEARRRFQFAFANHGTPRNMTLLKEATTLRHEMAGLFNFKSYADYVIRRRMARSAANVHKFLGEVQAAVTIQEQRELDELRAYKAKVLEQPLESTTIQQWDLAYWQQKLKKARYEFDPNAMRKYFPTDAAIPWIMSISSQLYGVDFKPVNVPVWHEEVKYFDVIDSATHVRIGGIYLDLFPREGKYGHAAAFGIRGVSTLAKRTPISVLVTNFNRDGLDNDELETLVHEFGHVLHGVLSATRYVAHAGTSVETDFVEAPSQMYEEWARRKDVLVRMSQFCKTPCPTVDDATLQRMTAAHNFGRGIRYSRQVLYASYDMSIHGEVLDDPLVIWKKMQGATPLGYVEGTEFPGQFGHLMGGYGAGYYGYMWSEVLALDMLSAYDGKLINPQIGRRYRNAILSRGGELRGDALVRSFLGREPNSKAFFAEVVGQRVQ